jgi:hypothetical protein
VPVLVADSTAAIVIPAAFGLFGTVVGALISRDVAVRQHRAEQDARARLAGARCLIAIEELRDEDSVEHARSARASLTELGYASISAGVDTRLALGAVREGNEFIDLYADPDMRSGVRGDPLETPRECAAALIAAVNKVPYWKRRGPFMDPDMRRKSDEFNALRDIFSPIHERPYNGPMWQLARLLDRMRRFERWVLRTPPSDDDED